MLRRVARYGVAERKTRGMKPLAFEQIDWMISEDVAAKEKEEDDSSSEEA